MVLFFIGPSGEEEKELTRPPSGMFGSEVQCMNLIFLRGFAIMSPLYEMLIAPPHKL